jgi:hypothetical protein
MKIGRDNLIELCEKFLNDQIDKSMIQDFAWRAISDDEFEWDEDEIISNTLFDWDNEEINFPINKVNTKLWKDRLSTGQDKLLEYNNWDIHIDKQKLICNKYYSNWSPINKSFQVGVSSNLDIDPINGLRHPSDRGTTGWFIWTGEYSHKKDFFHPICAQHLLQIRPEIIKYLGLDIGFRFLSDKTGYEDIWYDETLKDI